MLPRAAEHHPYLAVETHPQVRVQIGIHEDRRQQVGKMVVGGVEHGLGPVLSPIPEMPAGCAQNRADLLMQPHARVGVEVGIDEDSAKQIDELAVLCLEPNAPVLIVHWWLNLSGARVKLHHRSGCRSSGMPLTAVWENPDLPVIAARADAFPPALERGLKRDQAEG
jgi:hypothetical protein